MSEKKECCLMCKLAGLVVAIGALNWGLVGAFRYNLVNALVGSHPKVERIIYIVIGICAVLKLLCCCIKLPCCKKGSCEKPAA